MTEASVGIRDGEDAFLLFPKVPELWTLGKPVVWVCREVGMEQSTTSDTG